MDFIHAWFKYFTKIKWAGNDCILVTSRNNHDPKIPILILTKQDLEEMKSIMEGGEKNEKYI